MLGNYLAGITTYSLAEVLVLLTHHSDTNKQNSFSFLFSTTQFLVLFLSSLWSLLIQNSATYQNNLRKTPAMGLTPCLGNERATCNRLTDEPTKKQLSERDSERVHERTKEPASERSIERSNGQTNERANGQTSKLTNKRTSKRANLRTSELANAGEGRKEGRD